MARFEGMAFASLTKPIKVEAAGPDLSFFTIPPNSGVKSYSKLLMQHVLQTGKRVFSAAVAAATIAFSVGAGLLVSPASVSAASAGDLIKGTSLSTVYYYGYDGMRYVFPNETTYMTWFSNFDGVSTISDSALSDIALSGNVVIRPGAWWVKVQSSADVYAVGRDGNLYLIEEPEQAEALAGSDWNKRIVDVPDVFFADYTVAMPLAGSPAYDGALYSVGGTTYLSWDGEMREVTSAGMSANGLMSKFVLDGASIDDSDLTLGSTISSELTSLVDVAQTETDTPAATGDLTVSAASSMPVGSSLTKGANGVEVFSFNVKAGSTDAMLDGVVLKLIGAGSATDISAAYLYEGDTRLTESRTVNSSTREVTFNSLDVAVGAGDTATLTVKVTMSTTATAADTFGFEIVSADSVTASGDVSGNFPVSGDEFSVGGATSGTITITKTGSINDPTIGENDAEIANFKVAASSSEAASIELITLKVDNASDHSDFNLWDGSTWLASCDNTSGDQVVCDLSSDPFEITEGNSNIFTLSADIGGQDNDTVKVYVDNAIDVVAVGGDYGYGLTVDTGTSGTYDGTSCTSSSGKCSFSTVQGGEVTLAFNGPSAGDIQVDAQDQVLLEFSLTAAQEVTVKDLDIIVYADDDNDNDATDAVDDADDADATGLYNGTSNSLTDIRIVNADTGAVVMASMELDNATDDPSQTIDFTDDFTVEAGETLNLVVTADVDDAVASGTEFAAAVDISGLSIEDANGDALSGSDIVPGSDITGYNQSAKDASLAISLASSSGDATTVQGTDAFSVVAFNFTAGDASDVTVTDVTVSIYGDDDGAGTSTIGGGTGFDPNDYFESCSLYDGSTLVGGPEALSTNGQTVIFNNMDWMLDASEVATLTVKCNLANPSDTDSDYFTFDIVTAATDVLAEDGHNEPITVTGDAVNGGTTLSSANIVTVSASGTLAAAKAGSMPIEDILRTGSANNLVATYRFTATNEAFNIETLSFSEEQAEDDMATTDSSAYASSIGTVSLAWDGMTGSAPSTSMSGNQARFSGISIPVSTTEPTDVDVYVNVSATNRVSGYYGISNSKIRMGLFVDTTNDDNFKASGSGSGSPLDDDDISAIGDDKFTTDGIPTFVVKETYPSIARSSASPSGSNAGGRPEVLRFNISASSGEDVVVDSMIFKITSTDVATTYWNQCDLPTDGTNDTYNKSTADFDIQNRDNLSTYLDTADAAWTLYKATGAVCDSTQATVGFVGVTFSSDEVIAAGDTNTYSLYMSTSGAGTSTSGDDSLLVEVVTDPIVAAFAPVISNASAETSVAATDSVITVDSGAAFTVGDVLDFDVGDSGVSASDEKMLVVGISTNDLTVVRGYLGSNITVNAGLAVTDDIYRIPGAFNWKDDGVAGSVGSVDDWWGAYLVDITDFSGATAITF